MVPRPVKFLHTHYRGLDDEKLPKLSICLLSSPDHFYLALFSFSADTLNFTTQRMSSAHKFKVVTQPTKGKRQIFTALLSSRQCFWALSTWQLLTLIVNFSKSLNRVLTHCVHVS